MTSVLALLVLSVPGLGDEGPRAVPGRPAIVDGGRQGVAPSTRLEPEERGSSPADRERLILQFGLIGTRFRCGGEWTPRRPFWVDLRLTTYRGARFEFPRPIRLSAPSSD